MKSIGFTRRDLASWYVQRNLKRSKAVVGEGLVINGLPTINICMGSTLRIGVNCKLNSGERANPLCGHRKVNLSLVTPRSSLSIGDNVGMSGVTIFCANSVQIGNFVNIGAGVQIYDTDFHPIDLYARRLHIENLIETAPVVIEDDVWVGVDVKILKGVRIGKGAIIGAGSIVTRSIPAMVVAAGVPARVIRSLSCKRDRDDD